MKETIPSREWISCDICDKEIKVSDGYPEDYTEITFKKIRHFEYGTKKTESVTYQLCSHCSDKYEEQIRGVKNRELKFEIYLEVN